MRSATSILRHILGVDDAYACQRTLKETINFDGTDSSAQKFRLSLSETSYMHINVKFFCLNALSGAITPERLQNMARSFRVDRNDVVLIRRVLSQRGLRAEIKRAKSVALLRRDLITPAAFENVFKVFGDVYPDILRHIKRKTYTKLRFVSVSSNIEFHDFHMDLVCKAIHAYMKLVPTDKSTLYIANYLRVSVNNHVSNMIKAHTSQKRRRMVKGTADGFGGFNYEIPVVSENQLFRAFGVDDNVSYENLQCHDVYADAERVREGELMFDKIVDTFGTTKTRKALILLLSGKESRRFTQYLIERDLISPEQDNVDFSESVNREVLLEQVCKFLTLKVGRVRAFLSKIGREIYPEKQGV